MFKKNTTCTNLLILLILFINLISLTACSFHLRNQNSLPAGLRVLYVESDDPFGDLDINLKTTLASSGITLVDSPKQAPVTLKITKPEVLRVGATPGTSNETRVYKITYRFNFSLLDPQGETLLSPTKLSISRELTLNANQLLDSNNQLSQLELELQREIIGQLYNRLTSQQVVQLLSQAQ